MAETNFITKPETTALAEFMEARLQPGTVELVNDSGERQQVLFAPRNVEIKSIKPYIDEYRLAPERRKGTANLAELGSFIAHVNRFKDADSALFAQPDPAKPTLTAVLNYHRAGEEAVAAPRFGDHRAHYAFPLSDEWQAWAKMNGQKMAQGDFAAFLEDRITDVLAVGDEPTGRLGELLRTLGGSVASPNRLLDLSRGLQLRVGEQVRQAVNLSTGEAQIQYTAEHQDADGKPLKVPNLFAIGIPVFRLGAAYQIAVRLRYRSERGAIAWFYEMHRTDLVFADAFREACETAREQTALPLFYGSPE